MEPKKLSYEDFLKSLELCPRLVVELLLESEDKEIYLIKREKIPFENHWHLPGGFLLKGEKIKKCALRIFKEEIGMKVDESLGDFIGLFETLDGDPRGHILHYVIKYQRLELPISNNKHFFRDQPELMIPYQKDFLRKLGYK